MDLLKIMAFVLAILCAGCAKTIPQDHVAAQMRACRAAGGEPVATTVSQYNSAVKWVTCYGAHVEGMHGF